MASKMFKAVINFLLVITFLIQSMAAIDQPANSNLVGNLIDALVGHGAGQQSADDQADRQSDGQYGVDFDKCPHAQPQ